MRYLFFTWFSQKCAGIFCFHHVLKSKHHFARINLENWFTNSLYAMMAHLVTSNHFTFFSYLRISCVAPLYCEKHRLPILETSVNKIFYGSLRFQYQNHRWSSAVCHFDCACSHDQINTNICSANRHDDFFTPLSIFRPPFLFYVINSSNKIHTLAMLLQ
jgi:hypothetical protein